MAPDSDNPYESPSNSEHSPPEPSDGIKYTRPRFVHVVGVVLSGSFLLTSLITPGGSMSFDAAMLFFFLLPLAPSPRFTTHNGYFRRQKLSFACWCSP